MGYREFLLQLCVFWSAMLHKCIQFSTINLSSISEDDVLMEVLLLYKPFGFYRRQIEKFRLRILYIKAVPYAKS